MALRLRPAAPLDLAALLHGGARGGLVTARAHRAIEAERLARVALSRVGEPGDPRLTGLVARAAGRGAGVLGPAPAGRSRDPRGTGSCARTSRPGCRRGPRDASLEQAQRRGMRFRRARRPRVARAPSPTSAHAPPLHRRGGIPVGLWLRGPARPRRGHRGCGRRGRLALGHHLRHSRRRRDRAHGLAEAGRTVVSGAAFGIDQAAHRGALAARGRTVAVLACGVDRAYPAAHRRSRAPRRRRGCVVSEAAPGCAPTRMRFLARNRLIAALTRGHGRRRGGGAQRRAQHRQLGRGCSAGC